MTATHKAFAKILIQTLIIGRRYHLHPATCGPSNKDISKKNVIVVMHIAGSLWHKTLLVILVLGVPKDY